MRQSAQLVPGGGRMLCRKELLIFGDRRLHVGNNTADFPGKSAEFLGSAAEVLGTVAEVL
ncbi:MAG TPA: hypothetical protein VKA68_03825 [bacterium]|nr:hypothetical protein [bacterium]